LSEALLAPRDLVSAAGGGSSARRDGAGGVSWNLSLDALAVVLLSTSAAKLLSDEPCSERADLGGAFWNDTLENTSDAALTTATSRMTLGFPSAKSGPLVTPRNV
jgi:hypothetical protein